MRFGSVPLEGGVSIASAFITMPPVVPVYVPSARAAGPLTVTVFVPKAIVPPKPVQVSAIAAPVSEAVLFGPYRTLFNLPARITIPYDSGSVTNVSNVRPYIYNEITQGWDPVYDIESGQGIAVDSTNTTVTFDVQVLGIFMLGEPN